MSTADDLRELSGVAGRLFGVTFAGTIAGDPPTAAALIQAQALHRLADALAPLERIADALEANRARGEEPMPIDTRREEARQFAEEQREVLARGTAWQDLPIRIKRGWVHGYTPAATGLPRFEEVKVYDPSVPEGWKWARACDVTDEDLWAPAHVCGSPMGREVTLQRRPASSPPTAPREPQEAAPEGEPAEPRLVQVQRDDPDPLSPQILPNGILVRGTPTPEQLVEILRLDGPPSTIAPRDFVDSADRPQLPPWITDHLPNEFVASKGWVQVRAGGIFASFVNGDRGRIKPWNAVATGEAWAPLYLTKTFTYHVADAIPWRGFLAASSSTPSDEPAEPATTPDESEAAMEIREAAAFGLCAPQEPPQPASATPGGHPLDQGGWIRSRVPTEGDADEDEDVRVLRRDGKGSHWCHYSTVVLGQPWVPSSVLDPSSAPIPLPAHLSCPTSEGWVHDRVPGPKDGDGNGDVMIPANGCWAWLNWSHVVPGQPWRPLHTPAR